LTFILLWLMSSKADLRAFLELDSTRPSAKHHVGKKDGAVSDDNFTFGQTVS